MNHPAPMDGGWNGPQFPQSGAHYRPPRSPAFARYPYSLTAAFDFGWRTAVACLGSVALVLLPLLALGAVIAAVRFVLLPAGPRALVPAFSAGLSSANGLVVVLVIVIGMLWMVVVQSVLARAALSRLEGAQVRMATLLGTDRLGAILQYGLVVTLPTTMGALVITVGSAMGLGTIAELIGILGLPIQIGLTFVSVFGVFFVLKGVAPGAAIAMSYRLVSKHWVEMLTLAGVSTAVILAGLFLFGIGLLLAIPVVVFAEGYAFKTLRRRSISI